MSTRYSPLLFAAALLASTSISFAQTRPDGTPGNPPSTATGRAVDRAQGETPRPDGTPGNPPGTAASRAADRVLGTNTSGTNTTATTTASLTPVDAASLRGGRSARRLLGTDIYGANDRDIGEIEDIIIPPGGTGAPVAVLSVGGFLGIGERHVAVPYAQLQHNAERDRWMLPGATEENLKALPAFALDEFRRGRTRDAVTGAPATEPAGPRPGTLGGGSAASGQNTPANPPVRQQQ